MCKVCNNNYPNCPVCMGYDKTARDYTLDFAFEAEGYDVNITGNCTVSMNEQKIIELTGEAYLTDDAGEWIKELKIEDYKTHVWSAIFGNLEMVYNENKFTEYES